MVTENNFYIKNIEIKFSEEYKITKKRKKYIFSTN